MKYFLLASFIGIANNIWRMTKGTGGGVVPSNAILDRFDVPIVDRNGVFIVSRS